jgi:hypothetical protein
MKSLMTIKSTLIIVVPFLFSYSSFLMYCYLNEFTFYKPEYTAFLITLLGFIALDTYFLFVYHKFYKKIKKDTQRNTFTKEIKLFSINAIFALFVSIFSVYICSRIYVFFIKTPPYENLGLGIYLGLLFIFVFIITMFLIYFFRFFFKILFK